jgi:co-chaperonin GroES (HSP10)
MSQELFNVCKCTKVTPIRDCIIISDMEFGERLSSGGIILPVDDGKSAGIRPRWGKVYSIGPEQNELKVGQWVCVAHGRWTRGATIEDNEGNQKVLRKVDNNDILLVSDEKPEDATMSGALHVQSGID